MRGLQWREQGRRWRDDNEPWSNLVFVGGSVRYVLMKPTDFLTRPPKWYWWKKEDFSFCLTAIETRDENPWYEPSREYKVEPV